MYSCSNSTRDSNKANTAATTTTTSLIKKSSNGLILDETSQAGQSQVKLMPILE
ncbi:unnamed protein product, partial [Rotaria magnacalcarata]